MPPLVARACSVRVPPHLYYPCYGTVKWDFQNSYIKQLERQMNAIESLTTLNGYSRAREILFERLVQNSKTTVLPCANTISLYSTRSSPHQGIRLALTNKQIQVDRVSILPPPPPPARRVAPDSQLFSLGHVLCLASDVKRAQPRYQADKFLAFCARLEDAHLPILTGEHFLHSTQTPLTVRGILNNEHYIPVVYASCVTYTQ